MDARRIFGKGCPAGLLVLATPDERAKGDSVTLKSSSEVVIRLACQCPCLSLQSDNCFQQSTHPHAGSITVHGVAYLAVNRDAKKLTGASKAQGPACKRRKAKVLMPQHLL